MSSRDPDSTASGTVGEDEVEDLATRPLQPEEVEELSSFEEKTSLEPGEQLGRYVVLRELGRGGMSVVYGAYDPQLDRRVALKIMRRERTAGAKEAALRLQREAQALARLSHRNVVRVYDVGTVGGDVYVAMELVEGCTVRDWLEDKRRGWPAVLETLLKAGEGLAAAHRVGLVHLDFKPSNVLLGDDGRVRVVDFGLAREPRQRSRLDPEDSRMSGSRSSDEPEPETGTPSTARLSDPLTEVGAVMGTPGYIAPEQLMGLEADSRSDQFAFCVTLWQALYGRRPFRGKGRRELERSVLRGKIDEPRDHRGVPQWLSRIVRRGLSRDPEARYPDMATLLEGLRRDPLRRRRRILVVAGVVVAAAAGFAIQGAAEDRRLVLCSAASVEDVWNPIRSADLRESFAASGLPYAIDAWNEIVPRLDDYGRRWAQMRVDACEATHVRNNQSAELLDLRMVCLDRSRRELEAVVQVLERADAPTIENAVDAVEALPVIGDCSKPERLRGDMFIPNDPEQRDAVEELEFAVARISALRSSGHYGEARAEAGPLLVRLRELDHKPLFADFVVTVASVYSQLGLAAEAEEVLEEGLWAAEESGLDHRRAAILVEYVFLIGNLKGDFRRARWFAKAAHAALDRTGGNPRLRGDLMTNEAVVETMAGDTDRAIEISQEVLELRRRLEFGTTDTYASVLGNLGSAYFNAGDFERALEYYQQAYELRLEVFGPRHPVVAISLENLGNALTGLGRFEQSLERHRQAYELTRRAKIPEGVRFGVLLNNIAVSYNGMAKTDQAADYWEQSQAIWAKYDPGHVAHGIVLCNLGEIHRTRGEHTRGKERYVAAQAILEEAVGPEHPYVAVALGGLGRALTDMGQSSDALEPLRRARQIHDAMPLDALNAAEADFQFAKALYDVEPSRRAEAIDLARKASAGLRAMGPKGDPIRNEAAEWLDRHAATKVADPG